MNDKQPPAARTGMLVRKPVAEVFRAFIDPAVTTRFWFTKGSGPLAVGESVTWEWERYGASSQITPTVIEPERRIVHEWDGYTGRTTVEYRFAGRGDGTFVSITESGWTGTAEELLGYVADSTQGFTWVLAGLKAVLEHDLELNLVMDRYPDGPEHPYPDR
jgi:uncharacterized protein YndB with AHSA1/START domain